MEQEWRLRSDSTLLSLRKRLAIDQLRVRRQPPRGAAGVDLHQSHPMASLPQAWPSSMETTLRAWFLRPARRHHENIEEEELDTEERVQRCQADARQYFEMKPEMAWSRAQQAVALSADRLAAVADQTVRDTAYLTLAGICFLLGSGKRGCPSTWGGRSVCRGGTGGLSSPPRGIGSYDPAIGVSIALHRATASRPWLSSGAYFRAQGSPPKLGARRDCRAVPSLDSRP